MLTVVSTQNVKFGQQQIPSKSYSLLFPHTFPDFIRNIPSWNLENTNQKNPNKKKRQLCIWQRFFLSTQMQPFLLDFVSSYHSLWPSLHFLGGEMDYKGKVKKDREYI